MALQPRTHRRQQLRGQPDKALVLEVDPAAKVTGAANCLC
jgi:hypothetical protein